MKIFAANHMSTDCLSKDFLFTHFSEWASKQRKINIEIKAACFDSDSRYLTNLIELYCGYEYQQINDYLRYQKDLDHHEYREKAHLLTLIVYNAPRIQQDFVVFRSVCPEFIQTLSSDKTAYERGFMSTTCDLHYATNYCEEHSVLKIYVPRETPCIYTDIIKDRDESELLFPPNAGLQLIAQPYKIPHTKKKMYECKMFYYK